MRQMRFTTVQELKSQPKLLSWLYAKDLVMIACFVSVSYTHLTLPTTSRV